MMEQQRGAVTPVMNMSLFLLLLLSGLPCSGSGISRKYHYIHESMTWAAAQSYCRERYADLATVDSMDDVNQLMNIVDSGYSGAVWIGLKRTAQSRWGWSMGNGSVAQYSDWNAGEPSGDGGCVYFAYGKWYDRSCSQALYFVCYNERTGNIMIQMYKNWTDAQSYCRQHHTDLATIGNAAEQNQTYSLVGHGPWVWIGLSLDSWQWSDQWNLFFRNWDAGQPINSSGSGDCVAMSTASGKWTHYNCGQRFPFVCYGADTQRKMQIVRLHFSCHGCTLNDPSVQATVLNKISEKLKSVGLEGNNTISWRKDEGGEIFHLESNRTTN